MNFNAYRRCLSAPLPAQQLSGPSYEEYFVFMNLAIVEETIIFRNQKFVWRAKPSDTL